MGTEYYIVKPSKKEIFYLGKRISCLEGLHNGPKAQYATWEYWEDVVFDLQENSHYFLEGMKDCTVGQIWDFCYAIYEFCDDKVFLGNDCSNDFTEWKDYKEIDKIEDIFETTELEKWSELFLLVPEDRWVYEKDSNIILEYETVKSYLKSLKGE